MDYCGERGIPLSKFRSWSSEDQDAALAWMIQSGNRCVCGTYPEEWLDEDGYPVEPPPYEVASRVCLGCKALDAEYKMISGETGVTASLAPRGTVARHDNSNLGSDIDDEDQ